MSGEKPKVCGGPCGWIRIFASAIFLVAFIPAMIVFLVVTALQLVVVFFTGFPYSRFKLWGETIAIYIHQLISYLTAYQEKAPWPFAPFPEAPDPEEHGQACILPAKPKTKSSKAEKKAA